MSIDPAFLTALGDIFLNLSAGWFGAAIIIPGTYPRNARVNLLYVMINLSFGCAALVFGYQLRILGV